MIAKVALIVLSAVLANHLGLVEAVENLLNHKFSIVSCPKCCSFWLVLIYTITHHVPPINAVAISFLCAYAALWLELLCGVIDRIYRKIYESIYTTETDNVADYPESTVSELQERSKQ